MRRFTTVSIALIGLAVAIAPPAMAAGYGSGQGPGQQEQAGERVIVVDAPDIRKIQGNVSGPRLTELVGTEIYSNSGKRIGEIEDFVIARDGRTYAVIDTSESPLEDALKLGDGDVVVLPLQELRRAALSDLNQ